MALTFVYFYKKDSTKNISKKAEFLTNQVLNLCSEENVELEKYLTYEEIINEAQKNNDYFVNLKFKNRDRILDYIDWKFYFETFLNFFEDSFYVHILILKQDIEKIWKNNDEIEEKILDLNKKIIENNNEIEACISYNTHVLPIEYDFSLTKTKNNLEEVKEWIANILLKKDWKILLEKGVFNIYWNIR